MLHGKPLAELGAVIDQCLTKETGWVTISRGALAGVTYSSATSITNIAVAQRKAFDTAEVRRPREAHDLIQSVVAKTDEPRQRGWLKQQGAAYLHAADAVQAQRLQVSAQTDNRALLKPRAGVEYERLNGTSDQSTRAATFLADTYGNELAFQLGLQAIIDDLAPDPSPAAVEKFEQAVGDLGEHLGFETQRPERDTGRGPDVLWKIGELTFLVIECKSGVETEFIAKNDAAQLSGSIDWFRSMYDSTCQAVPLMIHRVSKLHAKAAPREGMRVITFDKLEGLREAAGKFARALASKGSFRHRDRIGEQLQELDLSAKTLVSKWSVEPRA